MTTAETNSKLTTILAADVVGHSRIMAADEETKLATLKSYLEVVDALIVKHGGHISSIAGDAF